MKNHDDKGRIRKKPDPEINSSYSEIEERFYQTSIDKNLKLGGKNNKRLKGYYNFMKMEGNKVRSIENKLKVVRYFLDTLKKDVMKATREDIDNFLAEKKRAPATLEGYKIRLKNFFWWLNGAEFENNMKKYPKIVSHIKTKNIRRQLVEDYELVSKEDIKKLCENCLYLRDKAMIMILYDGALRIAELCALKIRDVVFDDYGVKITVRGKTGMRKIRLVESVPALKQWINQHPFKDDESKELFICLGSRFGKVIDIGGAYKIVAKTKLRAKIKSKIHPHAFRHTRLTELAKAGYNESELRLFAGWSKSSNMPSVYLHIGEKDLDNKILRENRLMSEADRRKAMKNLEEERKKLEPMICPQCQEKNSVGSQFCYKCGQMLNKVKAERIIARREKRDRGLIKLGNTLEEFSQSDDFPKFLEMLKMFKATGGRSKKELEALQAVDEEHRRDLEEEEKVIHTKKQVATSERKLK